MPTILRNSKVKIGFKITLPILIYHETDTCTSKNQWFYQKKSPEKCNTSTKYPVECECSISLSLLY